MLNKSQMIRLQGIDWIKYIKEKTHKYLGKTIFSTRGNVRIETRKYYHWCNDYEKKIIFMFIRNNKDLFIKENRTFIPIEKKKINIQDIFKYI